MKDEELIKGKACEAEGTASAKAQCRSDWGGTSGWGGDQEEVYQAGSPLLPLRWPQPDREGPPSLLYRWPTLRTTLFLQGKS